jgi:hypothetical protein
VYVEAISILGLQGVQLCLRSGFVIYGVVIHFQRGRLSTRCRVSMVWVAGTEGCNRAYEDPYPQLRPIHNPRDYEPYSYSSLLGTTGQMPVPLTRSVINDMKEGEEGRGSAPL